jgi:thioesterase domain-containing protein
LLEQTCLDCCLRSEPRLEVAGLRIETAQGLADRQWQVPSTGRQRQSDRQSSTQSDQASHCYQPAPLSAPAALFPAHRVSQTGFETLAGWWDLTLGELQQAGGQLVGDLRHVVPPWEGAPS